MEAERAEVRTVGNLLMTLLNDFEFYEPTQPAVRSPVIKEAEKGDDKQGSDKEKGGESEEMDEENRIDELEADVTEKAGPSRNDKGKQKVVKEDVPSEKQPIYLKELGTTIPADELQFNLSQTFERRQPGIGREAEEMDFGPEGEPDQIGNYYWNVRYLEEQGATPGAKGETPVQSRNGNAGAEAEAEEKELEQERGVTEGGEPEEMDRSGTPEELAASTGTYDAWNKRSIKGQSEIMKKGKAPLL